MCCKLVQRIKVAGIRNDGWFKKNYLPVRMHEDEDVSLDDVQAVFSDSEVSQAFFSCLLQFCLYGLSGIWKLLDHLFKSFVG
jgi:hypothetical protein